MCFYFFKWKMLSIKKKFGLSSGFWIFSKGINLHGSKDHNMRGGFFRSTPRPSTCSWRTTCRSREAAGPSISRSRPDCHDYLGGTRTWRGVTLFLPYRVWGLGHAPLYPNLSRRGLLANLTWTEGLTWIAWPTPGGGGGGSKGGTTRRGRKPTGSQVRTVRIPGRNLPGTYPLSLSLWSHTVFLTFDLWPLNPGGLLLTWHRIFYSNCFNLCYCFKVSFFLIICSRKVESTLK
jgi:hypothetical protein